MTDHAAGMTRHGARRMTGMEPRISRIQRIFRRKTIRVIAVRQEIFFIREIREIRGSKIPPPSGLVSMVSELSHTSSTRHFSFYETLG